MLKVLQEEKLYINMKKCYFLTSSVIFLGFVASAQGVKAGPEKIAAILNWLAPKHYTRLEVFMVWLLFIDVLLGVSGQ